MKRLALPLLRGAAALAAVATLAALAGCGGQPTATPTSPPTATAVPLPPRHACYQLTYDQAVAPTTSVPTVPCGQSHTSQTYAVGTLSSLVDGHLVAVDSARVQRQVSSVCPRRIATFLGGTADQMRLSMFKPVWFTPTVAASDDGADWFRCDVVVLAGASQLSPVTGSLKGALGSAAWAMCGTDEPGKSDFVRVPCGHKHSWKALSTVPLPAGGYPGEAPVKQAGQKPCKAAGQDVAKDALKYQWGYEWPTADQWRAGQTYGICWAPS